VGRCFLKARENPPEFHYQGAFRSWLVRILIDEALLILIEKRGGSTRSREQVFSE
jgi:DNA-directed RNA polymerase specialized sigma24 family protein